MSENLIQDEQDRLIKAQLKELEKARNILIGQARKWYRSPYTLIWLTVFALFILDMIGIEISFEIELILIIASVIGYIESKVARANQRIDKIVELTETEKKLKEEYQSVIRNLAQLESNKDNR